MITKDRLLRVAKQSVDAARQGGSRALKVARRVAEPLVERRRSGSTETTPPPPPAVPPSRADPLRADVVRPSQPAADAPPPEAPAAVPDAPQEPEPEHVDREAVVVAVSADPGADEGPGAQIHVDEPWAGYDELNVKQVGARLADASLETLAIVRLYESANRNRSTVLDAIDRKLAANGS